MLADRIEGKWIDAFAELFEKCAVKPGDTAAILSETQSRALNVHLAELALLRLGAQRMTVTSAAGSNLTVDMRGAPSVGIWGWTDRAGTLAHWPGGIVVSFPKAGAVNGTLVLDTGDVNLTFKRYLQSPVRLTLEQDYVTRIEGEGADAEMMRGYLAAWGDREAYAVSHVGFGMNPKARYEALAMYDRSDTNGTELRAVAGNFLFSTGANEFAGRYTAGHFDIPVMKTTITLDNTILVRAGVLQDVFG